MSADVAACPLTVATWNVHGGVGRDRHYSPSRIADVVLETGADVIALQEVGSKDSSEMLLDALVRGTGFAAVDGWTCRRGGCDFGNVVLSRFPIVEAHRLDLTVDGREPREFGRDEHRAFNVHMGINEPGDDPCLLTFAVLPHFRYPAVPDKDRPGVNPGIDNVDDVAGNFHARAPIPVFPYLDGDCIFEFRKDML